MAWAMTRIRAPRWQANCREIFEAMRAWVSSRLTKSSRKKMINWQAVAARACAERGLTHFENLNNLKDVVNQRFDFYGFPLRLEPAAGSPIRAVGILEE